MPDFDALETAETTFSDTQPPELRADLVIKLTRENRLVSVIIVEVQRGRDVAKKRTWPSYHAYCWRQYGVPSCVLVFTQSRAVARWASAPIDMGHGFVHRPIVIGPSNVPRIDDPHVAVQTPSLSLLSALVHGNTRGGLAIIEAFLDALAVVDEGEAESYYDLLMASLNDTVKEGLQHMLKKRKREYHSDFARKYFGDGKTEGKKELLKKQLCLKFGALNEDQEVRIDSATSEQLDDYTARILTAETPEAVFNG